MAVTKAMTKAIPHVKSSKVETWELEMKYENDSEGDATYYTTTFGKRVDAVNSTKGITNFTKAAKGTFNLAALTALCPVSHWDKVFASQVESVITSPVVPPVADTSFSVPS